MFVSTSTPDKRTSRVHDGTSFFDTAGAARRDSKVSVLTKACRDVFKFGYRAVPGIQALNDRSSVTHMYGYQVIFTRHKSSFCNKVVIFHYGDLLGVSVFGSTLHDVEMTYPPAMPSGCNNTSCGGSLGRAPPLTPTFGYTSASFGYDFLLRVQSYLCCLKR
jgi:hypothetical protein